MDFFFHPQGIALIGASQDPRKGGYIISHNILKGYQGGFYPVNPKYQEIAGHKCYPTVLEVPDPVDLAIIFIPAPLVPGAVEQCIQRGLKGAIIESGGFAESGPEGMIRQEKLAVLAQRHGFRIWGPNCMGLVDVPNKQVFSFVSPIIWDSGMIPGQVSLIVQSGMLSAGFLTDIMSNRLMGISKACSIGNKMDINECDLLEYLIQDPQTEAIALYLESIPQGRRFTELCAKSSKPVVVLKGGKSPQGAKAALSHTASLAGHGGVVDGALKQAGIVQAKDFRQLLHLAHTLASHPKVPQESQGRIAVLTYSGGAGIVSTDFMQEMDICLAELDSQTKDSLAHIFPDWMPVGNPIDLWPAIERHGGEVVLKAALQAIMMDPGVDGFLLHLYAGSRVLDFPVDKLADFARQKPGTIWVMGPRTETLTFREKALRFGLPVFDELYRAVECLNIIFARNGQWLFDNQQNKILFSQASKAMDNKLQSGYRTQGSKNAKPSLSPWLPSQTIMDEVQAKMILKKCKVPTVKETIVETQAEAVSFAEKNGLPVVLKGLKPGEIHKSEQGLVLLGLTTLEKVHRGYGELKKKLNGKGRILIQEQVTSDLELIVGYLLDPQFGPTVMIGLGGIFAEVLKDMVFALAPLSQSQARQMIAGIKNQSLLSGIRGREKVDLEALAQVLVEVGKLGTSYPAIKEIDINPLVISQGKPVAVDATIITS